MSSPHRPVAKVTYAGKQKKKRESSINHKEEDEDEQHEPEQGSPRAASVSRVASMKRNAKNATPKKVDVVLPGPSPKRPSADQSASAKKPASTAKKGGHSRTSSIISLAREGTLDAIDASPSAKKGKKPVSSISAKLSLSHASPRPGTPDSNADDQSSVGGDSSKTPARARKTEEDRREFLENDPHSGEVEPHRVMCKTCDQWVTLNPKLRYVMKGWLEHRKQCKSEAAPDDDTSDAGTSVTAPSPSAKRPRMTEEQRKAYLENDPNVTEFKTHEVLCKHCQSWIKLSPKSTYSLGNWYNHNRRCTGEVPSTRVATAARKLKLVNDSQMKAFSTRTVDCNVCNMTVDLEGEFDYDLTKWEEHKASCPSPKSDSPVNGNNTASVASNSTPHPPPSTASTEDTAVASESSPSHKGQKRPRDDEGDSSESGQRAVRPRKASYDPPQGDSPGFLDRLVAPFKSFVNGFRQGLSQE